MSENIPDNTDEIIKMSFPNPAPDDWNALSAEEKKAQIAAKEELRTKRKAASKNSLRADIEATARFDKAHEKILDTIESYFEDGYVKSLAKLLVYLGEERKESALEKLPSEVREKVKSAYEAISAKRTDPTVIVEAGHTLKTAGLYGKTLADSVLEGCSSAVAEILMESGDRFLEKDPLLALNVERNTFLFEDIIDLDDRSIQKILREVDSVDLAKALKGVETEIQDKIFRNMSRRAATMLKEDMEYMGPVRIRDVEEAQQKIVSVVLKLVKKGEIVLFSDLVV